MFLNLLLPVLLLLLPPPSVPPTHSLTRTITQIFCAYSSPKSLLSSSLLPTFNHCAGVLTWDAELALLSGRCGPNVSLVPYSVDWNDVVNELPEQLAHRAQPEGHNWTRSEGVYWLLCDLRWYCLSWSIKYVDVRVATVVKIHELLPCKILT